MPILCMMLTLLSVVRTHTLTKMLDGVRGIKYITEVKALERPASKWTALFCTPSLTSSTHTGVLVTHRITVLKRQRAD